MEQFGLGYEALSKINPSLIYASISGKNVQSQCNTFKQADLPQDMEHKVPIQGEQGTTSLQQLKQASSTLPANETDHHPNLA